MKRRISSLLCLAAVSLGVTSPLFWHFERAVNPNVHDPFDAVWWWVITSATVGYGDIVPATTAGRIVGIFAVLTGFFVIANLVAILAESARGYLEQWSRGTAQVRARDHVVICEYTAIADELVQSLPKCPEVAQREVVIVSDLVARNPYAEHHFVCGVPLSPAALRLANVQYADYVFIFANLRFADPDVKTMHVASRILDINDRAKVFVELVDPHSDLLPLAPRGLVAMPSRQLIEDVLSKRGIDLQALIVEQPTAGGGRPHHASGDRG